METADLSEVSRALAYLCRAAQWGRSDADDAFIRAMCRGQDLFDGLLLAIREPHRVVPSEGSDTGTNVFQEWVVLLVETIFRKLTTEWAMHREPFIRLCRKAKLLDGLEVLFFQGFNRAVAFGKYFGS